MGLTKKTEKSKETAESAKKPKAKHDDKKEKRSAGGLDEIDSLFAEKKKHKQEAAASKEAEKQKQKQKKKAPPRASTSATDWVDDGLGGIYNSEGYTGRVEDGMKIFKTHLLQSSKSGTTPDCPFDCDCCYI